MDDRRRAWVMTGALWLGFDFYTAYEIAPASLLPLIRDALEVGPTAGSWLVSSLLLAMAIFSLPAGMLLDRVDDRRTILVTAVALFLASIWAWDAGESGSYHSLLAARFVSGALIVTIWTAAVNVVDGAFDQARQGTAIAFLATSIPGGFAIGHATAPTVSNTVGWTGTMLAYVVVATLAIGGYVVASRGVGVDRDLDTPTRDEFVAVLRNPYVWAVGGMAFATFSLNLFFNNWLPSYVSGRFELPLGIGGAIAAVFPAIGVVARLSGGLASDHLFETRRRPIILGSFVVIAPASMAIPFIDQVGPLLLALVIAGFVTQIGLVLLIPYVRELVPETVSATAFAVLNTIGFLGAFSAPVLTGALIEESGFVAAFGYATVLALAGIVLAWWVPEASP